MQDFFHQNNHLIPSHSHPFLPATLENSGMPCCRWWQRSQHLKGERKSHARVGISKKSSNTVDGSEIRPAGWYVVYPHYSQGFIHSRWLAGFLPSTVCWNSSVDDSLIWSIANKADRHPKQSSPKYDSFEKKGVASMTLTWHLEHPFVFDGQPGIFVFQRLSIAKTTEAATLVILTSSKRFSMINTSHNSEVCFM